MTAHCKSFFVMKIISHELHGIQLERNDEKSRGFARQIRAVFKFQRQCFGQITKKPLIFSYKIPPTS